MDSYIIGVTAYYHDSSACLFKNGEIVYACEEERFTGIKHDSTFPNNTINHIFEKYELTKSDIEAVCYYEKPMLRFGRIKSFFTSIKTNINVWRNLRKISNTVHYTPHHISHMAYSYLSSDFKDATLVSIDGVGETTTVSIGKGVGDTITELKTVEYPHSLGLFYSAMTAFLGFKPNEGEYKLMGLASYGDPTVYQNRVDTLIEYDDGEVICDMACFVWDSSNQLMFDFELLKRMECEYRLPNTEITQAHKNIAASVQKRYEDIFFEIINESKELNNSENLVLGGGCAYNGTANGKLIKSGIYRKYWIPSNPSDAGSAIGSCLYYLSKSEKHRLYRLNQTPFLGDSYTNKEIYELIKNDKRIRYVEYKSQLNEEIAKELNNGKVVGWFKGKMEFGARALGNRSILANPTLPDMQNKINRVVKKREEFRPFAPMVTYNDQATYFDSDEYIPYMNQIVHVKPQYRDNLPAVTHVDGSSRVQSVKNDNPIHYLLREFQALSGYPILLNTSFNIKDKTIVRTPQDAIETFLDTEMDILVLENFVIYKRYL
jgi:carbamoyltransferase